MIQRVVQLLCRPLLNRLELIELGLHLISITKNLLLLVDLFAYLIQLDQGLFFHLFVVGIQLVDFFTQRLKIHLRIFEPCGLELFHFFLQEFFALLDRDTQLFFVFGRCFTRRSPRLANRVG